MKSIELVELYNDSHFNNSKDDYYSIDTSVSPKIVFENIPLIFKKNVNISMKAYPSGILNLHNKLFLGILLLLWNKVMMFFPIRMMIMMVIIIFKNKLFSIHLLHYRNFWNKYI